MAAAMGFAALALVIFQGVLGGIRERDAQVVPHRHAKQELPLEHHRLAQRRNADACAPALRRLQQVAAQGGNVFGELLEAVKHCSLGQISNALYAVGGQYRRGV